MESRWCWRAARASKLRRSAASASTAHALHASAGGCMSTSAQRPPFWCWKGSSPCPAVGARTRSPADGQAVVRARVPGGLAAPARRRQEAAPRAQVVHALPAVVAAPAPLDGHGAALKVGLRRSADPAQLVRPPSKLCVPLHVLTSISQPAGLPQRGRKQSRPHTRIADSPTCWASCTGGPCC